jgi:hypothetical protein
VNLNNNMIIQLYYKNIYISLNNYLVLYHEKNKIYLYSNTSSRKIKESLHYYLLSNNNEINKYIPVFNYKNKKYKHKYIYTKDKIIEKEKLNFFKENFYENKGKLKIIGRGWKITKYSNQLLIKLGYSHYIFLFLHPIFKYKMKKKKKKYYNFYSVLNNSLNTLLSKIKLMRVSDVYTRKGIYHHTIKL